MATERNHSLPSDWRIPAELRNLSTPCYVLDPQAAVLRHGALKKALGTGLVVSLKANPNPDLFVRCAQAFVDGVELASVGELNTVVGRATIPKIVNTPAMDSYLMSAAIASRATVVLDARHQVEMFAAASPNVAKLPVIIRLNAAGLVGDSSERGGADHFGMDVRDALTAIARLRALGHGVRGLHVFAGSSTFAKWSARLVEAMEQFLPPAESALGGPLELVNLGGGFPEDWETRIDSFARYRRLLESLERRTRVYHEAGRGVFSKAGHFVTKVLALKSVNGSDFAICDGGLAQCFMLAQTEKVMKHFARPEVVAMNEGLPATVSRRLRIVGNTCSRADVIGELESGVTVAPGDRLIFQDCGAYTTYSPATFLSMRPAHFYLIS